MQHSAVMVIRRLQQQRQTASAAGCDIMAAGRRPAADITELFINITDGVILMKNLVHEALLITPCPRQQEAEMSSFDVTSIFRSLKNRTEQGLQLHE